jgi:hypothetical protein
VKNCPAFEGCGFPVVALLFHQVLKGTSSIAPDASNYGVAPPWSALLENCGDLNDLVVGEQRDFRSSESRK